MVSYENLWRVMKEKNIKKIDLHREANINDMTIAKLTKNEFVTLRTLYRIGRFLNCSISDMVSFDYDI